MSILNKMKIITKLLVGCGLLFNLSSAGTLLDTQSIGMSKITLDDEYHKALFISSTFGYTFDNDLSLYFVNEGSIYRHRGYLYSMSDLSLGLGYSIPYTNNKLTIGANIGLGANIRMFPMFNFTSEFYDFGLAYGANVAYNIYDDLDIKVIYTHYDFNTNDGKIESTKTDVVSVALLYHW